MQILEGTYLVQSDQLATMDLDRQGQPRASGQGVDDAVDAGVRLELEVDHQEDFPEPLLAFTTKTLEPLVTGGIGTYDERIAQDEYPSCFEVYPAIGR